MAKGGYGRARNDKKWRYDDLSARINEKDTLIAWLMVEGFLARNRVCSVYRSDMALVNCSDRSDGAKWECRRQFNGKKTLQKYQ